MPGGGDEVAGPAASGAIDGAGPERPMFLLRKDIAGCSELCYLKIIDG